MKKERILDPRERKAIRVRRRLKEELARQQADLLAGVRSEGTATKVEALAVQLVTALATDPTVECFRCSAPLDMISCPAMYIVTQKYVANGLGGYDGGQPFYPPGTRSFVLCDDCDEYAESYDAAQEVPDDEPEDEPQLEQPKGKA